MQHYEIIRLAQNNPSFRDDYHHNFEAVIRQHLGFWGIRAGLVPGAIGFGLNIDAHLLFMRVVMHHMMRSGIDILQDINFVDDYDIIATVEQGLIFEQWLTSDIGRRLQVELPLGELIDLYMGGNDSIINPRNHRFNEVYNVILARITNSST